MSVENVAVVRSWFEEVWNKGRVDAIDEMLAADAIVHGLGEPGVDVQGADAFKAFFAKLRDAFPDVVFTVDQTIAEGDWVASRWTARATHRGDTLGMPATGRRISVTGMSMARIRDGQLVESWNNWDIMGLMQQLGTPARSVRLID